MTAQGNAMMAANQAKAAASNAIGSASNKIEKSSSSSNNINLDDTQVLRTTGIWYSIQSW